MNPAEAGFFLGVTVDELKSVLPFGPFCSSRSDPAFPRQAVLKSPGLLVTKVAPTASASIGYPLALSWTRSLQ
jgi:hypothetical protein